MQSVLHPRDELAVLVLVRVEAVKDAHVRGRQGAVGSLAHSQAEMLLEVPRGLQKLCEELVCKPSLNIVVFTNFSGVEDLPECTAMVPPPLPVSHDGEHQVVAGTDVPIQV